MNQKRTMIEASALALAAFLAPALLWAGIANVPTRWSDGLENWRATSENNSAVVTQQDGAVMMFKGTTGMSTPPSTWSFLTADQEASYGMFAGDLYSIGATAVSFRVTGIAAVLSKMTLLMESQDGQIWTYPLPVVQPDQSLVYRVTMAHGPGWWDAEGYAGNAADFTAALGQVKRLELKVLRGASRSSHGCAVDTFKLIGPAISGAAIYEGEQPGTMLKIRAEAVSAAAGEKAMLPSVVAATATAPAGSYRIEDAAAPQTYRLKAYLDVNGNEAMDFWEPRGEWDGGEFVLNAPMNNADIVLSDPATAENIPYWWLVQNCGAESEEQILGRSGADWIRDWAGQNFTVRIVNLGNGRVALRWKHIPNQRFEVEKGEAPGAAVLRRGAELQSVNATGDQENELIQEISGSAAQFYRIKLVMP